MNVTKNEIKDRQLHKEDYLQMISAEQKEYVEVSAHLRITENNSIITDFQTVKLMEQILQSKNLNEADMKGMLRNIDEWLRRRIRAIYWKQWKKVKTIASLGYMTMTDYYLKTCEN